MSICCIFSVKKCPLFRNKFMIQPNAIMHISEWIRSKLWMSGNQTGRNHHESNYWIVEKDRLIDLFQTMNITNLQSKHVSTFQTTANLQWHFIKTHFTVLPIIICFPTINCLFWLPDKRLPVHNSTAKCSPSTWRPLVCGRTRARREIDVGGAVRPTCR